MICPRACCGVALRHFGGGARRRSLLEGMYDLCPGTGCDVARDVPARLWVSMIYVYIVCMVSFTYRNVNDKLLLFITILLNCIL